MKYPTTFLGSIASSAPILQFKDAAPVELFYKIITDSYTDVSPKCSYSINRTHRLLDPKTFNLQNLPRLQDLFGTCKPIKDTNDLNRLISFLNGAWSYMAMTNYPYPTSFLSPMPAWPVTASCQFYQSLDDRLQSDEEIDEKLFHASRQSVGIYYNYTGQQPCFEIETNETPDLDADGWYVLACNQMAMTMAADGINDFYLPEENSEES